VERITAVITTPNTSILITRIPVDPDLDPEAGGMVDPWETNEAGDGPPDRETVASNLRASIVRPSPTSDFAGGGTRSRVEWILLLDPGSGIRLGDEVVSAAGVTFRVEYVDERTGMSGALAHTAVGLSIVAGIGL
jgi:hypothetical protein